jgi:hypothetical protein
VVIGESVAFLLGYIVHANSEYITVGAANAVIIYLFFVSFWVDVPCFIPDYHSTARLLVFFFFTHLNNKAKERHLEPDSEIRF